MSEYYLQVKAFLQDLDLVIEEEHEAETLFVVNDEDRGIHNLIVDCEDPILILEQVIMPVPSGGADVYRRLLEINRTLIHGAFAIDEETNTILFRDTLRLDTLDRGEIEGTINALGLALAENGQELISFSHR